MLSALTSLRLYTSNPERMRTRIAQTPDVKRESEYFAKNIAKVTTAKEFTSNYRLFSFAMKAFNLTDMVYAKSYMTKLMDGGVVYDKAPANRLTDPRFKEFVKAFNFGDLGSGATSNQQRTDKVVGMFVDQRLEETLGEQNEATRLAAYFIRRASSVTSAFDLLADKALYKVVTTLYNMPTGADANVDAKARLIDAKLKIADLQDPKKVEQLMTRFTVLWDVQNPTTTSPAVSLLSSTSNGLSLLSDSSFLLNVQKAYSSW